MSTNYDLDALFHPNVELGGKTSGKNESEYSPSADKGTNGVYKSIIRFVTWWQDPQHSFADKWICWLVDPVSNRGKIVDCPSSVGKPSPLQDMYWKLKKSESIQEQKKADIFSRKHQYAAIIQVIKDDHNKESEGKLLIWKFGKKVFEKIEAEKKPVIGEPHEPFDLINGKAFAVVITKAAGFNNYDQSRFLDQRVPLLMPDAAGKMQMINAKTPRADVLKFLQENSPNLSEYGYKEWDQEIHEYVNSVILAVTGQVPSTGYADARNSANQKSPAAPKSSPQGITATDINLDTLGEITADFKGLGELDLPDIGSNTSFGIPGDLDDAIANL